MDTRLEGLKRSLESAVEGMSHAQMNWHPPEKWCAAEVLEHLYLTYTGTIRGFERVLLAGNPLARPTMKQRAQIFVVTTLGYLPAGRKSPPVAVPKGLPAEKVQNDIGKQIAAMDGAIAQCEARYGSETRMLEHPILGPLTATQWRKFHVVHGLHHRKQLVRLRAGATQAS